MSRKTFNGFLDNADLGGVGEKTAVDAIVRKTERFPLIHETFHFRREVRECEVTVRKVIAEQCCRERTNLAAHCRDNWNGGGERTTTERAKVVNGENAFGAHVNSPQTKRIKIHKRKFLSLV